MKQRFLTAYIDPKTGNERLGIGANAQCVHRYANVKNVIRFGLAKDVFPAGQYNIYVWPLWEQPKFVMTAYKRA